MRWNYPSRYRMIAKINRSMKQSKIHSNGDGVFPLKRNIKVDTNIRI